MQPPKTSRGTGIPSFGLAVILSATLFMVGAAEHEKLRSVSDGVEQRIVYATNGSDVTVHRTSDEVSDLRVDVMDEVGLIAARWTESGKTGLRQMVSISRSGGLDWSRPQALGFDIALRAGRFDPQRRVPAVQGELAARDSNRIFIVQFETMSLAPLRQRLQKLGAELLVPVPEHAYLVRMAADQAALLQQESFVRWVGPFHPA